MILGSGVTLGAVSLVGFGLARHLLERRCGEAVDALASRESFGAEGRCEVSVSLRGMSLNYQGESSPAVLTLLSAETALEWGQVVELLRFRDRFFPFQAPMVISVVGQLVPKLGEAPLPLRLEGRFELFGDGRRIQRIQSSAALSGFPSAPQEKAELTGIVEWGPRPEDREKVQGGLSFREGLLLWRDESVRFDIRLPEARLGQDPESRIDATFGEFRLGLLNELVPGSFLPRELEQLRMQGRVSLGSHSWLEVTDLKGPVSLVALRERLKSSLLKSHQGLGPLLERNEAQVRKWIPDEAVITVGKLRVDGYWEVLPSAVASDRSVVVNVGGQAWELRRHASSGEVTAALGEWGTPKIKVRHETTEGALVSGESESPSGQVLVEHGAAGKLSLGLMLKVYREAGRVHVDPTLTLPDSEVSRLLAEWGTKAIDKIDVLGALPGLQELPQQKQLKSLEESGKSWLKGWLRREGASDPDEKQAGQEEMRAKEKELKEKIRALLER